MRMLLNVDFPVEPFNSYVRDGSIGGRIQKIMAQVKPEAAYFTERQGARGATMVVNVKEAAEIPGLAEPFFLQFDANVEIRIAMLPEDLAKSGLETLGKTFGDE